jgi:hypothetical protein
MKKKHITIIVVIILLLAAGGTTTYILSTTSKRSQTKTPKLAINITDYPSSINSPCQKFTITANVQNTGEKNLEYSELESNEYEFLLLGGDIEIASTNDPDYYLTVSNFQTLKVGETKSISFTPGNEEPVFDQVQFNNHVSRVVDGENASRDITISFNRTIDSTHYAELGVSSPVSIDIDVWEDPSINLLKSCIE